jgi:2-hydroxychromene-2-carboxylate isomerase
MARSTFFYDFAAPHAYLVAERISELFNGAELEQPEWVPVLQAELLERAGREWWASGPPGRAEGMADVERRAAARGLPVIAWPKPWPADTLVAMRAATFAKQTGRAVSFSLAAFRQAFAAGRDLSDADSVVIAGAACELHPRALLKAVETEAVRGGLREATAQAAALGVEETPAVVVGERVFLGDDRLEEAVEAAAS